MIITHLALRYVLALEYGPTRTEAEKRSHEARFAHEYDSLAASRQA